MLLINDQEIENFIITHQLMLGNHTLLHCSGAHISEWAHTVHPPMTFNAGHLYSLEEYKKIPFILEKEGPPFAELLPGLPNPHAYIFKKDKAYYHTLCVLANNFTTLLWQKLFSEFQTRLESAAEIAMPYLRRTCENLQHNYSTALTGPLVRNDHKTIENHLAALADDDFLEIYSAFVNSYNKRKNTHENT